MSDWLLSVITALGCFTIGGGCVFYLRRAAGRVRWSKSQQQIITRHPRPVLFWTKVSIVGLTAFLSLGMGVVLLVMHGRHFLGPPATAAKSSFETPPADSDR